MTTDLKIQKNIQRKISVFAQHLNSHLQLFARMQFLKASIQRTLCYKPNKFHALYTKMKLLGLSHKIPLSLLLNYNYWKRHINSNII